MFLNKKTTLTPDLAIKVASIGLIPFFYTEVLGARVIVLGFALIFILCIAIASFERSVKATYLQALSAIILAFAVFNALLTTEVKVLASITLFLGFLHLNSLFTISKEEKTKSLKMYSYMALIIAALTLIQFILNIFFNLEFGNIKSYGLSRVAYGFLWTDYSYLSLYFCSAIPLTHYLSQKQILNYSSIIVLFLASAATSARTGIAALIIFLALKAIYAFFYALHTGYIAKSWLFLGVATASGVTGILFKPDIFPGRPNFLDDSGRIKTITEGISSIQNNHLLGLRLDLSIFDQTSLVVPHNLFAYIYVSGGLVFTALIVSWLFFITFMVDKDFKQISNSLIIVFIGLQAVPSPFAAYFISILLAIAVTNTYRRQLYAWPSIA